MAAALNNCHSYYYSLSENKMRDENERRIFLAIKKTNLRTLHEIVDPPSCRLGSQELPLLSVAVLKCNRFLFEYLIDRGCDPRQFDNNKNGALYLLILKLSFYGDEKNQLLTIDYLLASCSNAVEAVFMDKNKHKMTPFLLACALGYDAIIMHFLNLLENYSTSIPIGRFVGYKKKNVFHFLLEDGFSFSSTRLETVRALIDKIPICDQLIDKRNADGSTALYKFLCGGFLPFPDRSKEVLELAKLFFSHGACPDTDNNGRVYLEQACLDGNVSLIEILLRAGCRPYIYGNQSLLSYILKFHWRRSKPESIRVIELLLALGFDLQKEYYLYTSDERPIGISQDRDSRLIDRKILRSLQEVRRSNELFSLQRQCRNAIRRHCKGKADEVIGNLTCIPPLIKSYLLVENERPLLKISKAVVEGNEEEEDDEEDEEEEQDN